MLCSKASKHPLGNDSVEVETHPKSLKHIKKVSKCSPNEPKIAFWDPLGTFSALSSIQDRTRPKKMRKESQNGGFLDPLLALCAPCGIHMEDQVAKKSIQKAFKASFAHI